jgi:hypothetical protein
MTDGSGPVMATHNGRGHDLRLVPAVVLGATGVCLPASEVVCSCGFSTGPIVGIGLLNYMATQHLRSAARIMAAQKGSR